MHTSHGQLKGTLSHRNIEILLCLLHFHVISPNATNIQLNWIKRFYGTKQRSISLEKKVQDYKDGSGLQFIKFHFYLISCQAVKKSKFPFRRNLEYFSSVHITFGDFFSCFKIIKHA